MKWEFGEFHHHFYITCANSRDSISHHCTRCVHAEFGIYRQRALQDLFRLLVLLVSKGDNRGFVDFNLNHHIGIVDILANSFRLGDFSFSLFKFPLKESQFSKVDFLPGDITDIFGLMSGF